MAGYNNFPSYNAYTGYPANSYQQQYTQAAQQYAPQPQASYQQTQAGICWVDGEVGAKAQQLPPGWDTSKPFPMWDTNDQIIYLKSFNAMGMPNPLTKLHYTIEEPSRQAPMMSSQANLPAGGNGRDDEYVRREDLERMKDELKAAIAQVKEGGARNAKPAV